MYKKFIPPQILKQWFRYLGIAFVCVILISSGNLALAQPNQAIIIPTIEFPPIASGTVLDDYPRDGFPDIVDDGGMISVVSSPLIESQGVIEFDVSSLVSGNSIQSALLKITPIGRVYYPETSTLPIIISAFLGDCSLQTDDFDTGTPLGIVDGLAIPLRIPLFIDVSDYLQSQSLLECIGFNLRMIEADGGLYFGSSDLGLPPILIVQRRAVHIGIDIQPNKYPNIVYPNITDPKDYKGLIHVSVLTTPDFNARTVDPTTVRFGPAGASAIQSRGIIKDVDRDGDLDITFGFHIVYTGINCGDTSASLSGSTFDGQHIYGTDSIQTQDCTSPYPYP